MSLLIKLSVWVRWWAAVCDDTSSGGGTFSCSWDRTCTKVATVRYVPLQVIKHERGLEGAWQTRYWIAFSSSPAVHAVFSPLPCGHMWWCVCDVHLNMAADAWCSLKAAAATDFVYRIYNQTADVYKLLGKIVCVSVCVCAKPRGTYVLWPAWKNKWKWKTNLNQIQAASQFPPTNLLHQLHRHQQKGQLLLLMRNCNYKSRNYLTIHVCQTTPFIPSFVGIF